MLMKTFEKYLVIINIIGFLMYLINMWLYSHTKEGQVDKFLTILSLAGASPGILLAIVLFDKKAHKGTMMSRVFVISVFIIQIILFLMWKGYMNDEITLALWEPFLKHRILLIYFGIINFITFIVFAIDKVNAQEHRSRIKIVTLLGLSFIGGSIGALLAIYLLHHKTKKDYFTVGIPIIMIMQVIVLFYLLNAKFFL
ncbi:MAG: DUF1294 domain-containing protein [Clostridiales bacterium]|nr:DUF1294 domain-containing protein [Clostridiales bacterium]